MRFDVCIDMLFVEFDWFSRISKCFKLGISAVEFWNWDQHDPRLLRKMLDDHGMEVVTFVGVDDSVTPLTDSSRKRQLLRHFERSLRYASEIGVKSLIVCAGPEIAGVSRMSMWENCVQTIGEISDVAKKKGVELLLEPLNRTDHPGSFVYLAADAVKMAREVGGNVKVLLDIFHERKEQPDTQHVLDSIRRSRQFLGHIHIADVPDRHEPGTGSIEWKKITRTLNEIGYDRFVGLECIPAKTPSSAILKTLHMLHLNIEDGTP